MNDILLIAGAALAGACLVALALTQGFSVRPSKISFPFLEVELSKFEYDPAVSMFSEVSAASIPMNVDEIERAIVATEATPVMLIHTGWNLVCEAFIRRFQAYPDDNKIMNAASVIGGQNVEFVRMYRDIHASAIGHPRSVTKQFAANYLVRAPSMAERVEGRASAIDPTTRERLALAQSIVQDEVPNGPN